MSQPDPLATFWRQATPGTTYWRCSVPARHLPGRVNAFTTADLAPDENGEPYFPNQAGQTAIWQFSGNATRGLLMAEMQELGYRVLMEVDDLYLMLPPVHGGGWQHDFARGGSDDTSSVAAHRRISEWVDGIICSTERLAKHYREINGSVFVCPNSVEPDDWPEPLPRDDDVLRIGWAASNSHMMDQHLVRRAMEWAAQQKRVEVYTIGYQPAWRGRINRVPWSDNLAAYRQSLTHCRLDVGICPVVPGTWADCKSDVKALEYAMTGALPIVSHVEPYRAFGGDHMSCESPRDWQRALRWCVNNLDGVREMARSAREYVLEERTIQSSIGLWKEAVSCAYVRHV